MTPRSTTERARPETHRRKSEDLAARRKGGGELCGARPRVARRRCRREPQAARADKARPRRGAPSR
eukprot:1179504-Pyramimonas_sp.AAC.1